MAKIIMIGKDGKPYYEGLLSSKERCEFDEVLSTLQSEIPEIETSLKETYGDGVEYKYNLGLILSGLIDKYNVSISERRRFWDEIKILASETNRKRNEGINAKTRSFYEQCFVLARLDLETAKKLSWRQWQDLLDRTANREDERIFSWIKQQNGKIKESDWRGFEKALNMFLEGKDTSVFTENELFTLYNSIMLMCRFWRNAFLKFSKDNPKSAKIKNKAAWAKKFYAKCFELRKQKKHSIDETICQEAFTNLF